jgi:hypothetical protein
LNQIRDGDTSPLPITGVRALHLTNEYPSTQ